MFRLDGKTALVTGASQGIGRATALALAAQGARVVLAARNEEKLAAVADEVRAAGGDAATFVLDVGRPEDVPGRMASLPEGFADVDVLVNNAGITRDGLLARMTLEQWREVIDTNLTGAYAVTKELLRGMMRRRWGRIVFVSSVVGLMGNAGQTNYAASKAGLVGFAKSLAREVGGRGITVNVVAPGLVETAMTAELGERVRQQMADSIVLRRFGAPEDVAGAIAFLAGDAAGYVTGEVLNVSGGMHM